MRLGRNGGDLFRRRNLPVYILRLKTVREENEYVAGKVGDIKHGGAAAPIAASLSLKARNGGRRTPLPIEEKLSRRNSVEQRRR